MSTVLILVQITVALGLLNVWLVRKQQATAYRGGNSQTLRDEFKAYGLPSWAYDVVGTLKIGAAIVLLLGIFQPTLVPLAAGLVSVLMVGALAMHIKVKDPLLKSLPALLMLTLNLGLLFLTLQ